MTRPGRPATHGPRQGERDERGGDVSGYARLCTATPGVVQPTGPHLVLCPPESPCIDAVVTLGARGKWRTAAGTTAAAWYAQRRRVPMIETLGQLPIEAAS